MAAQGILSAKDLWTRMGEPSGFAAIREIVSTGAGVERNSGEWYSAPARRIAAFFNCRPAELFSEVEEEEIRAGL